MRRVEPFRDDALDVKLDRLGEERLGVRLERTHDARIVTT
jgi:hypothetical protein